MSRKNKITFFAIFAVGLILRLNNLSGRSLWTDEFFTLFQSTGHGQIQRFLDTLSKEAQPGLFMAKDFKALLRNDPAKGIKDVRQGLSKEDTHPPLYFLIMHLWMRLFGDGQMAVRLFSVLFGMLSIFLAYKVSRLLFDENTALFSALFVSISSFAVRYSQEARAYSMLISIGLCSLLAIISFEKTKKSSRLILYALLNCLGIFTHYFYIFVSLAQFLYFTFGYKKEISQRQKLYLVFLSSMSVFFLWFILFKLKTYNFYLAEWIFGHAGSIGEKALSPLVNLSHYLFMFDDWSLGNYLTLSGMLLFVYILTGLDKKKISESLRKFLLCVIMLSVPVLSMFFIDVIQMGALLQQERFATFSFIGFTPLAGYILNNALIKRKIAVYLFTLFMLLSSVFAVFRQYGPAPKDICAWINKEARVKSSAVVVCNIRNVVPAQAYYLDDDIYIVPVSSAEQLESAVKQLSGLVDKVFIARHYHRTDTALMDMAFMGIKDIDSGFKPAKSLRRDDISVSEFVK